MLFGIAATLSVLPKVKKCVFCLFEPGPHAKIKSLIRYPDIPFTTLENGVLKCLKNALKTLKKIPSNALKLEKMP